MYIYVLLSLSAFICRRSGYRPENPSFVHIKTHIFTQCILLPFDRIKMSSD